MLGRARHGGTARPQNVDVELQNHVQKRTMSSDHEFARAADRVRRVVTRLSPIGVMHNVRIRAPDPRKHALRITVENLEGVSLNDLAEALAPARVFIRSSGDAGSKIDIYFQNSVRKDLLVMELIAWVLAGVCLACFMKITMA